MAWYLSYMNGHNTVMHIFAQRDEAIKRACDLLDRHCFDGLQVGPMLGPTKGKTLDVTEIRQISEARVLG